MIIHPISDMSLFDTGQKYAPTAANFPGLKHFFMCNEATGSVNMVDSIAGLTVKSNNDATVTNNADGTLTLGAIKDIIVSGAVVSPGTKKTLLIWAGKPSSTIPSITFGDVTDGTVRGYKSNATSGAPVVASNSGSLISGTAGLAGNGSQAQVRCLLMDWGTDGTGGTFGVTAYDFDGTTWTARAAVSLATATGITTISQAITFQANARPAFIQIWHMTAVPGNIRNAVTWTYAMAMTSSLGYRKLAYPGWAGLT